MYQKDPILYFKINNYCNNGLLMSYPHCGWLFNVCINHYLLNMRSAFHATEIVIAIPNNQKHSNAQINFSNLYRLTWAAQQGALGHGAPHFCKNQENVPFFHWKCALLETLTLQLFTLVATLDTLIIRAQTIQN